MGGTRLSFRADALRRGFDDHHITKMIADGTLARVRPGVYRDTPPQKARRAEHLIAVRAAVAKNRLPAVVSHHSAAALHGLPLLNLGLARVHMTREGTSGGTTSTRRHLHVAPLAPDEITEVDGIPVTTVARTVIDLALSLEFSQAVAIGDNALNNALVTSDDLAEACLRARGRHGIWRAITSVEAMDCRAESPGESLSRLMLHDLGIHPQLQRVIRRDGTELARVDFFLEDEGIVGEFDGRQKYEGSEELPPPEDPGRVAVAEKVREDALRQCALVVARWGWRDLMQPGALQRKIDDARAIAELIPMQLIDPFDPRDIYIPRNKLRRG